jgi:arginine decarboxylase
VNYGIREYANDIVFGIQEVCNQEKIPCPTIISESGRMLTAYHSMLIAEVRGALSGTEQAEVSFQESAHKLVHDLFETDRDLNEKNYREYYHDALEYRDQMYSLFDHGALGLRDKAEGEALFWRVAGRAMEYARGARHVPEEFEHLESSLRKKYICNLSVFQSLPDSFALDQMFPIVPIHRLNERPDVRASLVDITCDSDGEVDRFIDMKQTKRYLEVHDLIPGRPYYLGFLLIGAYQETMGSPHNLFGQVHEAEAVLEEDGDVTVAPCRRGQTALDSLRHFGHDEQSLSAVVRNDVERQIAAGSLSAGEGAALIQEYSLRLGKYTYLD